MKRINFADTNEKVSNMALGCLAYGTKVNKNDAFEQLDYFLDKGGNFLDTSNNYSFWEKGGKGGESEAILGEWLKERQNRDQIFLATKLGAFPTVSTDKFFSYQGNSWEDLTEGLSKDTIINSVNQSLKRLKTDYIDLLYAHVDDRETEQEETLEAFDQLVKEGKVRHIGCSNFKTWRIVKAREISKQKRLVSFQAVQQFYTYFKSEPGNNTGMFHQMNDDLFDYIRAGNKMTLLAYTPLLWGSYTQTHKYQEEDRLKNFIRPQNDERRKILEEVASKLNCTINQVIYAWMLHSDPPVIPLIAVTKMTHLKEDLSAADLILPEEVLKKLNQSII